MVWLCSLGLMYFFLFLWIGCVIRQNPHVCEVKKLDLDTRLGLLIPWYAFLLKIWSIDGKFLATLGGGRLYYVVLDWTNSTIYRA